MENCKINDDPDDSGFLDVEYEGKDGSKKSMNFTGGFSRVISLIFQMASGGKRKNGVFKKYSGLTDPLKEGGRFLAGKAPPITRSVANLIAGEDMVGQDADIGTEAAKYKMPLAIGQIYKQIERDGAGSLFKEGILMYIGINAKDSRDFPSKDPYANLTKEEKEDPSIKLIIADSERLPEGGFMPPKVDKDMTLEGQTVKLTDKQHEDFEKMVWDERKAIIKEKFPKNYTQLSDFERKKALEEIYSAGREVAKEKFLEKNPDILKELKKQAEDLRKEVEKQKQERQ